MDLQNELGDADGAIRDLLRENAALTARAEMAEAEVERLREALLEIANRASNMMDRDAADWMPSIYKIACEAVGENPWRMLNAAGFNQETLTVSINQQSTKCPKCGSTTAICICETA